LNLSSEILTSNPQNAKIMEKINNTNAINIGACPKKPTVDIGGYTWDIIGYNGGAEHGAHGTHGAHGVASTQANTATLLLSTSSKNKFESTGRSGVQEKGKIVGAFDSSNWKNRATEYSTSDLRLAMDVAFNTANLNGAFTEYIIPRDLPEDRVYGVKFWALTVAETKALNNVDRTFSATWWLREIPTSWLLYPFTEKVPHTCVSGGGCSVGGNGSDVTHHFALRPAFYAHLTPEIMQAIASADTGAF
jgi:hypothetical protein